MQNASISISYDCKSDPCGILSSLDEDAMIEIIGHDGVDVHAPKYEVTELGAEGAFNKYTGRA